jgi:hypothetical protein
MADMYELTMHRDISLYVCVCVCNMCMQFLACLLSILVCKTLNPKPTIVCQRPKGVAAALNSDSDVLHVHFLCFVSF